MPGVVFLIVVPTENFERELLNNDIRQYENNELFSQTLIQPTTGDDVGHGNNLNINLPDNNAVLRLEVELRDKNIRHRQQQQQHHHHHHHHHQQPYKHRNLIADKGDIKGNIHQTQFQKNDINYFVPMEKVVEELFTKLEIDHVSWILDKKGNFYQIVFPSQSGDPCETTLHCLTELGIGTKCGSNVSILPCSVSYDAIKDNFNETEFSDAEEYTKWNNFVESIKSKLTVKQVVDGVRAGGSLSFDYLMLIVTADSLAALGLVENNAPNITAAMLVSPLMGPVMSITFGTIISDRELVKGGFIALSSGMLISLVFGFVFGLILGTTEMPWGFGDWPTEEMKGRGNARSLWMGILWALTSGTGVAIALLQGSAGPLIGVAISASLLPPVVNCGLFWALACIWLIYDGTKIPHIKGEPYTGNSSYVPIYTNYIPTEFLINGIVSGLLTVINVICIFITAIIVLKIKEVAAPYTSSPDLRRFWETDIKTVRKTNRSTIRRRKSDATYGGPMMPAMYEGYDKNGKNKNLEAVLEQAIREAADDETLQKVKRMSYSGNAAGEITQRLGLTTGNNRGSGGGGGGSGTPPTGMGSLRNSIITTDLKALDKLVTSLLDHHNHTRQKSTKLKRLKSLTNSMRFKSTNTNQGSNSNMGGSGLHQTQTTESTMPTIFEANNRRTTSSWSAASGTNKNNVSSSVRQIINTISNAPHRFSQNLSKSDEENSNLTQNIID